ncbi:MAG TPA: DUF3667 domain-containing protein [Flavobacteriales bacterium]|jgi:hypothetical protein|nr:DUF3667 domain-containing protein [Flavobacteriales bacterium]
MTCANCGTTVAARFCPACGQPARTERITGKHLLHELPHSILHVDKGLLYTMKELFVRPAAMIEGYLAGQRVRHFKPLAYVVILSAVASFVAHLVRSYTQEHLGAEPTILPATDLNYFILSAARFFSKYQSVFYFLMVPIISLCTWAFFHTRYNYWEHAVANTYLTAQFNLLLILGQLFALFNQGRFSFTPLLVVFFTYITVVYTRLLAAPPAHRTPVLRTIAMTLVIVLLYITGLSLAGMMTPWWGV